MVTQLTLPAVHGLAGSFFGESPALCLLHSRHSPDDNLRTRTVTAVTEWCDSPNQTREPGLPVLLELDRQAWV